MQVTKSYSNYGGGDYVEDIDGNRSTQNFRYLEINQTRTGEPNPNYRVQIRNGDNASTPFFGQRGRVSVHDGTATLQRWSPSSTHPNRRVSTSKTSGFAFQTAGIPVYGIHDLDAAKNQALIRAYKDVRQTMYQISGPTFIAEFREAVRMLRRPAAALRDYAMSYLNAINTRRSRSRTSRSPVSRRRVVADTWLEYSFGWSPFLSDIKAIAETLARFQFANRFATASGFGESSTLVYDSSTPSGFYSTATGIYYIRRDLSSISDKVKIRVGIDASMSAPYGSLDSLVELSGFQIQNFIPAAWEVLPWSFFVDYFSNIGDVLEAQCTDTSRVRRSQINYISEDILQIGYPVDAHATSVAWGSNFISLNGTLGSSFGSNRRVLRTLEGLTYPTLSFELPSKPTQLANLTALFAAGRRAQSPG